MLLVRACLVLPFLLLSSSSSTVCDAFSVFGRQRPQTNLDRNLKIFPRPWIRKQMVKLVEVLSTKTENMEQELNNMSVLPSKNNLEWLVYVDQSKASMERGGVATLDAFVGLAPTNKVSVKAALFAKPPKGKGPFIRCIPLQQEKQQQNTNNSKFSAFEVSNVNSVEKVYRVLTIHMKLSGITMQMCDCLKLKYKGNGYLEAQKVTLAIEAYDRALEMHFPSQQGVLLFMRAAAHAALAASHRKILQLLVTELTDRVPTPSTLRSLYGLAAAYHYNSNTNNNHNKASSSFSSSQTAPPRATSAALTNAILRKVIYDARQQEVRMRKIQYWHGLYQHAMLQALQDSLRATELLSGYAAAWERAGSILSDLWRLEESLVCYEKAQQLDPSLQFQQAFDRIRQRQQLLADAQSQGCWAEEPLRLALDIKG